MIYSLWICQRMTPKHEHQEVLNKKIKTRARMPEYKQSSKNTDTDELSAELLVKQNQQNRR